VLAGRSQIIVRDGEPMLDVLKLERVTMADVCEAARDQGIADLDQVSVGILEADGKFAFLRKDDAPTEQSDQKTKA
jgi:uncharacterized membrane protein YcaP (DUF421 family)